MWYTRPRRRKRLIIASVIILTLIVLAILAFINSQLQKALTTKGFVGMEMDKVISSPENTLVELKGECSSLTIYITPWQGIAIEEGIRGIPISRPSTHDIMVDIFEDFGIQPTIIKITRVEEGTYFAELYLSNWNRLLILDARPSDAIALSVRTKTPIYVNESLVTKTC